MVKIYTPKLILWLALSAAVPALWLASLPVAAQEQAQESEELVRSVRVIIAEEGELSSSRSTSVSIEPAIESRVAAQTSGQVASILVREGASVSEGQTVVQIDTQDLNLQLANSRIALDSARVNLAIEERANRETIGLQEIQLTSAQANFEAVRSQYDSSQALFAVGGVSQIELTGLRSQFEQAQAGVRQAQDALARSRRASSESLELRRLQVEQAQTQLSQTQRSLSNASIRAPFSGEIAEILVEEGEFIGAGNQAFRLVSSERQNARFSVPPQEVVALLAQEEIVVPHAGLDYFARIVRNSEISGQTRLVEIVAEIYPSEVRIPNGTVTQLNYSVSLGQGIVLPAGALQTSGGENFLFVVRDGRAERQPVQVIAEAGGQVITQGISSGTQVIFPVPSDLRSGTAVRIVN